MANGKQADTAVKQFVVMAGSSREAKSLFKSPAFQDSYQFPYNPDPLARGNSYAIYDEMMMDDQVKPVIALKKHFVVSTGWRVVCDDETIKQELENSLRDIGDHAPLDPTFDDALFDILSAYEYGFSLTEPVYHLTQDGQYGFRALVVRPPHTFRFEIDDRGKVQKVIQSGTQGDLNFKPELFLHHVYQMKFGNPYGLSDLNAAHSAWKAKKFIERFMAVYVEKFASPLTVGRYKTGMSESEIAQYLNVLETIQNNTNIVIPEDATLDIVQSARDSSDAYIKALDYYNMRIARSILVPDLMGLGGAQTGSHGGSMALGTVQFDTFLTTIRRDREALQARLTNKLINPLVKANYGEDVEAWFEFTPFTEDNLVEHARLWSEAVKGRIYKPNPEEIEHFRDIVGFPRGAVEIPEPIQPQIPGKPVEDDDAGSPGAKPDIEPGEKDQDDAKENTRVGVYRRLTEYEKKMDFTAVKRTLDAGEKAVGPRLDKAARKIISDYVDQVKAKHIITEFHPDKINDLKPRFQRDMNIVFRHYFADMFKGALDQARREIFPNGTKLFTEFMLPDEFLEILEAESFKVVGDYTTEVTKKMNNTLLEGIKSGASQTDVIEQLRSVAAGMTDKWLSTVIRTKTTEIYNRARRSYWETDALASQIVEAYQFSAVLDERTSDVCAHLDGQIFEKGDDISRVTPALHFNCRSLLVPITKFESYSPVDIPSMDKLREMGANLKTFKNTEDA